MTHYMKRVNAAVCQQPRALTHTSCQKNTNKDSDLRHRSSGTVGQSNMK